MSLRRSVLLATALTLGACDGGDSVLDQRVYVPTIPREAVLGLWSPESSSPTFLYSLFGAKRTMGPETLAVHEGGVCELSRALAQRFIDCEHAFAVEADGKAECAWGITGSSGRETLQVTFQDAERKARRAGFAVYRHQASGDIALVWTCAVGDARGLFWQGTLVP